MEYLVQYHGDTYIMVLSDEQIRVLSWLYGNDILPDDFSWNPLEYFDRVDLTEPEDF